MSNIISAPITDAIRTLRGLDRWVLHDERKIPFQPSGKPASSTDPRTWSPYAAVAAVRDRFAGYGFVFCNDDDIHGWDLDNSVKC